MTGQPGHDARDMNCAAARAVSGLHPELPGWTEQLATAIAGSGNAHDIRIDQGDRIAVEADPCERQHGGSTKVLIVFAASFCLVSAGVLGAYRFMRPGAASSPPPVQSPNPPAGIANASEAQRLAARPTIARTTDRAATDRVPAGPNVRAPTRIAHAKPSRAVPPAPSASSYAPPAPSPAASAAKPFVEARLTPVPETRPTTIDGWVLREVVNGTAVVEGPDGVWRVKRGDALPGIGQVVGIFAWGNRMIVATTKGLISTP